MRKVLCLFISLVMIFSVLFTGSITVGAEELPSLLGEYMFSGDMTDSSGNGHDGTSENSPTLTVDRKGKEDSAYYFTSGQYIELVDEPDFGENSFTVAFWFKGDECNFIEAIITKADASYYLQPDNYGFFIGVRDFSGGG